MDVSQFVSGIIGGAITSSAVSWFIVKTAKERWFERVKNEYAEKLEQLKSKLDQGNYVNQAQYDLELSSYKDLWHVMSELRERLKAIFVLPDLRDQLSDNDFNDKVKEADKNLSDAFNDAILISERLAPFYEKNILEEARATTFATQQFSSSLRHGTTTTEEIQTSVTSIYLRVEKILNLIRDRLTGLRPLQ